MPATNRSDEIWWGMKRVEEKLGAGTKRFREKLYERAKKEFEAAERMAVGLNIFGSRYVEKALKNIELCNNKLDSIRKTMVMKDQAAQKRKHDALEFNEKRMLAIYQELCKIAREYGKDEFPVNAVTDIVHGIEREYGKGVVRAKDLRRLIEWYGIPVEWDGDNGRIFYVKTKELLHYGLGNDLEIPYMHALMALAK